MIINKSGLATMLSVVSKCSTNNRMIPTSSLVCISVKDNTLTLETTDGLNFLYYFAELEGEDLYAVVQINLITAIVSKMNCENVELEATDGILYVRDPAKKNSEYKFPMTLDEDGNVIKYPDPSKYRVFDISAPKFDAYEFASIKRVCSASLSDNLNDEPIYDYYVGESVVATDGDTISELNVCMVNKSVLLNASFVNLVANAPCNSMYIDVHDDYIYAESDNYRIICNRVSPAEQYPRIFDLLDEKKFAFTSVHDVSKSELIGVVERLSIYNSSNEPAIYMEFGVKTGITVRSPKSNSFDTVYYTDKDITDYEAYTCRINANLLLEQLKTIDCDKISICYGNPKAIKIKAYDETHIVVLIC